MEPPTAIAGRSSVKSAAPTDRLSTTAHGSARIAGLSAIVFAIIKAVLYFKTNSLLIALAALDSIFDAVVSLLNNKLILFARSDADLEHPYGHGKAESMAAMGQGAFICGSALVIAGSSISRLLGGNNSQAEVTEHSWLIVGFFVFASAVSLGLMVWLRLNARKFNSPALFADAQHYFADVLVNVGSALSFAVIIMFRLDAFEPFFATLFSAFVFLSGYRLIRENMDELLDHETTRDIKDKAVALISESSAEIIDVHKFRSRKSGHRYFFDFHVTLPASLKFPEVHQIVETIEDNLKLEFDADVIVHADPDSLIDNDRDKSLVLSKRPPE